MGDPNGKEALPSSTAIGNIYPVSFPFLSFALTALRIAHADFSHKWVILRDRSSDAKIAEVNAN